MKILVACGNGMGTSFLLKTKIENVLRTHNIKAMVETASMGDALSIATQFDYFLYPSALHKRVESVTIPKAGVTNILFEKEIEDAFRQLGIVK